MKQMVVGLLVVAGVFTVGPWFAGKIGPTLAVAITEYATQEQPCATPTAEPSKKVRPKKERPDKGRSHAAREHRKPHSEQRDEQRAEQRQSRRPKPRETCAPTTSPAPRRDERG